MEKIVLDRDNYFIGENGIYLELQNTKEYIDKDGIKRIVIELKDQKIDKISVMSKLKDDLPSMFDLGFEIIEQKSP